MTSNDKMLDHTRQQLSALFDGELGLDEARFLQRRLQHDGELLAGWSRWQLAGDVLRGQAVAAAPAGFAERVAAALADAPAPGAARPVRRRNMLLPGAALAASVAAMAMFMTRQAPETRVPATPSMEIASTAGSVPAQPQPEAPAPATPAAPAAPDSTLQVAGTAIAVAEVPRRAAERRSRAQQQRAAATRIQRNEAGSRLVASATATPAPDRLAPADPVANPFVPEAAAEAITARPWPRALLSGGSGGFTVGYGRLHASPAEPHPFEPRPVALPTASEPAIPEDLD